MHKEEMDMGVRAGLSRTRPVHEEKMDMGVRVGSGEPDLCTERRRTTQ
jgi:hypothetical protein